ncbi:MAG: hypothetical protein PHI06_03760 [Desulfobulbaceae bacterium]|nr:hypothetical protein [Desulfobulbaceae bacterium]
MDAKPHKAIGKVLKNRNFPAAPNLAAIESFYVGGLRIANSLAAICGAAEQFRLCTVCSAFDRRCAPLPITYKHELYAFIGAEAD